MDGNVGEIETARQPGAALVYAYNAFGFRLRGGRVDCSGGGVGGRQPNPTQTPQRPSPPGGPGTGGRSFIDPESASAPTFQIGALKQNLKFFPAQPTNTPQSCHSCDPETRRLGDDFVVTYPPPEALAVLPLNP